MAAVVIVGVKEVCQGHGARCVGGVGPQAGPFIEQCALEGFCLAVGPGPMDASELSRRAKLGEGVLPSQATRCRSAPARREDALGVRNAAARVGSPRRSRLSIGVDLAAGEAGVAIDGILGSMPRRGRPASRPKLPGLRRRGRNSRPISPRSSADVPKPPLGIGDKSASRRKPAARSPPRHANTAASTSSVCSGSWRTMRPLRPFLSQNPRRTRRRIGSHPEVQVATGLGLDRLTVAFQPRAYIGRNVPEPTRSEGPQPYHRSRYTAPEESCLSAAQTRFYRVWTARADHL